MSAAAGSCGTSGTGRAGTNAWERTFRLWDPYFAVVRVATVVFVLGAADPGRPALTTEGQDEPRALAYVAGAVLLFLPAGILVDKTRSRPSANASPGRPTTRSRRASPVC
ncbi:hypothetical protein [Streptomyces sp. ActVer]|uniref:hypothetical protein n=1 Tax=Streptomyces sp. ActVer TaxID=3014558 RepID=UPI002F96DF7D